MTNERAGPRVNIVSVQGGHWTGGGTPGSGYQWPDISYGRALSRQSELGPHLDKTLQLTAHGFLSQIAKITFYSNVTDNSSLPFRAHPTFG